MFTTISTYYTFPKTIEQFRQNMTGHVTSRYQGLSSSEVAFSYPEPFLRAFDRARRGALAKSITGYHKNMVREQYPVLELWPIRCQFDMDLTRKAR
jgi:hypothetical protein